MHAWRSEKQVAIRLPRFEQITRTLHFLNNFPEIAMIITAVLEAL